MPYSEVKVIRGNNGSILGKIPIVSTMSDNIETGVSVSDSTRRAPYRGLSQDGSDRNARNELSRRHHEDDDEEVENDSIPRLNAAIREARDTVQEIREIREVYNNLTSRLSEISLGNAVCSYLKEDPDRDVREDVKDEETFFPRPRITFLLDRPRRLTCQICKETALELGEPDRARTDGDLAILPCGHVGCYGCLDTWTRRHRSCPFCRESLRRAACRHPARPVRLALDSVHALPLTLPRGGAIADRCAQCADTRSCELAMQAFYVRAPAIMDARRRRCGGGDADDAKVLEDEADRAAPGVAVDQLAARKKCW
ncbi:hypothetical protein GGR52DRAFT_586033 [Hypoxylon sp. FL1284]|nr:hypothetical protein GGR52DRAFT_586033 [Hypoxylon sp. FL1284]